MKGFKLDTGKPEYHHIPPEALEAVAEVLPLVPENIATTITAKAWTILEYLMHLCATCGHIGEERTQTQILKSLI